MNKIKPSNFICFSERKELVKKYKEFVGKTNVLKNDFNLITFLSMHDLLDVEKVKKYLEE